MEKIEMTCRCGASISIEMQTPTFAAIEWQENHKDCKYLEQQPTTATPTPTVPIPETPWGVEGFILPKIPLSSQSDQAATESGPVGLGCVCAMPQITAEGWTRSNHGWERVSLQCKKCGALMDFVKTPAQDVDTISSTSVKQPSSASVDY